MSKSYEYKSGKVGNLVYQRNRFGMICYPRFIPTNPRTEKQVTVRSYLATVSAYWRLLSDFERLLWAMEGKNQRSRRRLGRRVPLNGFNCFMRVNLRRLNRGGTLVERPEEDKRIEDGREKLANGKSPMAETNEKRDEGVGRVVEGCTYGIATVAHRRTYGILSLLQRGWRGVATVVERGMHVFSA